MMLSIHEEDKELILYLAQAIASIQQRNDLLKLRFKESKKDFDRLFAAFNTGVLLRDEKCMNPDCAYSGSRISVVRLSHSCDSSMNVWNHISLCEECKEEFKHSNAEIQKYCSILEKRYGYDYAVFEL